MSRYTINGSAALDAQIAADLQRITDAASPFSRAGVLIGGYGRGEGTPFINPDGSQSPFNDYDLVVIVDSLNNPVRRRFQELERELTRALEIPVDLCPYAFSQLRKCEFSLLNYEMKYGHTVIWGAEDILSALPDYPHESIPLSEGTRLLLNRGKLLLDIRQCLARPGALSDEERIRCIKFIHKVLLAFGDCALLAAGRYDVSYAVKKVRYPEIPHCPDRDYVVEGYLQAIELKNRGDFRALESFSVEAEFNTVREVFLRFMPWYRSLYSGREGTALKNLARNLQSNRRFAAEHPREPLYDVLLELLQERPTMPEERFRELRRRFS